MCTHTHTNTQSLLAQVKTQRLIDDFCIYGKKLDDDDDDGQHSI